MLAARMPPPTAREHGSIYHRLEQGFEWLERRYRTVLDWTLLHRAVTVAIALASFAIAIVMAGRLEYEFFPPSDEGISCAHRGAAGSSVEATRHSRERRALVSG